MITVHIIKRGKKWAVVREGAERAYRLTNTVGDAELIAANGFKRSGQPIRIITHSETGSVKRERVEG